MPNPDNNSGEQLNRMSKRTFLKLCAASAGAGGLLALGNRVRTFASNSEHSAPIHSGDMFAETCSEFETMGLAPLFPELRNPQTHLTPEQSIEVTQKIVHEKLRGIIIQTENDKARDALINFLLLAATTHPLFVLSLPNNVILSDYPRYDEVNGKIYLYDFSKNSETGVVVFLHEAEHAFNDQLPNLLKYSRDGSIEKYISEYSQCVLEVARRALKISLDEAKDFEMGFVGSATDPDIQAKLIDEVEKSFGLGQNELDMKQRWNRACVYYLQHKNNNVLPTTGSCPDMSTYITASIAHYFTGPLIDRRFQPYGYVLSDYSQLIDQPHSDLLLRMNKAKMGISSFNPDVDFPTYRQFMGLSKTPQLND